jgi:hypothetical protein
MDNTVVEKKTTLTKIAEACTILSSIAIIAAIVQIRDGKRSLYESELNNNMQVTTAVILPAWTEWKKLYNEAEKLDSSDEDFLLRVALAQDNWNASIHIIRPNAAKIKVIDEVKELMYQKRYNEIKTAINSILIDTINKELKQIALEAREKKIEQQKANKYILL